jgi:hypothetical protein
MKISQQQKERQRLEQLKQQPLKPIGNLRANFRHRDRGIQSGRMKTG